MNKKNKYMQFWAPDADGGGSTVAGILPPVRPDSPVLESDSDDAAEGEEPEAEVEPEPKPQSITIDPTSFAAAIKAAGLGAPEKPAAPTSLTPEQLKEWKQKLAFWEAKPEFLTKFNNLETQQQAFQDFHEGLTNQFLKMLEAYGANLEGRFSQQLTPLQEARQRQDEEKVVTRFGQTYEQLAKPELKPVFDAAVSHLHKTGQQFAGEPQLFKAIGETMATIIRASGNADFKLTAGSSPAKPTNPNAIKPTPRGGAGAAGPKGDKTANGTPLAVSLLPKVRA